MSDTRRRTASVDVVDAKVAVDLATAQTYKENVFLFVPNLIGAHSETSLFFVFEVSRFRQATHASSWPPYPSIS